MNPTVTSPHCAGLVATVCTCGFGFVHFQEDPIAASGTFTWIASLDRRPPVCYEAHSCKRPKPTPHTADPGCVPTISNLSHRSSVQGFSQCSLLHMRKQPRVRKSYSHTQRGDGAKIRLLECCQIEISQRVGRISRISCVSLQVAQGPGVAGLPCSHTAGRWGSRDGFQNARVSG